MKRSMIGLAAVLAATPAFAMTASFSWKGIPACANISPAFIIEDAPKGTKSLRFMMKDYDAPDFKHGGSTVPYTGHHVPKGAISYIGPCPPPGQIHRYIWTVEALDASGVIVMAITTADAFPPQ